MFPNKESWTMSAVVKNTGKYIGLKDTENIYWTDNHLFQSPTLTRHQEHKNTDLSPSQFYWLIKTCNHLTKYFVI